MGEISYLWVGWETLGKNGNWLVTIGGSNTSLYIAFIKALTPRAIIMFLVPKH
jgi:hypothetical protein